MIDAEEESAPLVVELSKSFRLEASHRLPRAPASSVCKRLHGHSWVVDVYVVGEVDPDRGWLIDYDEIDVAWQPIHDALDHRHLNDIEGLENPTSEILASWIWNRLAATIPGVHRVTVHETCTARCTYFGPTFREQSRHDDTVTA